jgi:hypothetical protein
VEECFEVAKYFQRNCSGSPRPRGYNPFWDDLWNGHILKFLYPQLRSFARNGTITVKEALSMEFFQDLFHLPLSEEAYEQFCELDITL